MYNFDAEKTKNEVVEWIRNWFEENGKGCNAVIGISGGKDSSVTAALCVEALGRDRVIGILMPNGVQPDIDCSHQLVEHLKIRHFTVNIKDAYDGVMNALPKDIEITNQTKINLAPRIRMTTLYAISQSLNGRVANTCNLSENWVGYSTRYGDDAGDFSPLGKLTVHEVKAIGRLLKLPENLIEKVPADGLTDKSDEDNLGFTYDMLDTYIREGIINDEEKKAKIDRLNVLNAFKLKTIATFEPSC